jgi:hypothetical protein
LPNPQIFAGVIKNRTNIALVCLLYLSVALVVGVVHHHHNPNPLADRHPCAACAWHVNAVTDVPHAAPLAPGCVAEMSLTFFESTPSPTPFDSFSHSRAPPVTSA